MEPKLRHWADLIASGRTDDFKETDLLPDFLSDTDPNAYDLNALNEPQRKALIRFWEAWQDELKSLRILDPVCCSGAFLIEAFDQFHALSESSNARLEELRVRRCREGVGSYYQLLEGILVSPKQARVSVPIITRRCRFLLSATRRDSGVAETSSSFPKKSVKSSRLLRSFIPIHIVATGQWVILAETAIARLQDTELPFLRENH